MFQNSCKLVIESELISVIESLPYYDDNVDSIKRLISLHDCVCDVCEEIESIHESIGVIYALRKLQLIDTHTWCTLHNKYVEVIDICKVVLDQLVSNDESNE